MVKRASFVAPTLLHLGFERISKPSKNKGGIESLIQGEGIWMRRGPRPWIPRPAPCFVKITGAVEMTVAIDQTNRWWCVLKVIDLEYLGFSLLGCLTTIKEE